MYQNISVRRVKAVEVSLEYSRDLPYTSRGTNKPFFLINIKKRNSAELASKYTEGTSKSHKLANVLICSRLNQWTDILLLCCRLTEARR
jgi:hypothetical protein